MRWANLTTSFLRTIFVQPRRFTIGRPNIMERSYKDAIDHLNSLQSNAATLEAVRASGGRLSSFAIPEMIEYLELIGYRTEDLNALNVIHITGTKGKGSTSAFVDSILRCTKPEWKIGLYTSPHLVAVRERIRINGAPLSEEDFARFFFEVWDKLDKNPVRKYETTPLKPGYFRFITLVAFHTFLSLKVDATVLEVGIGGAHDSTNIVPKPIVTGVTALGIDHTIVLGKTLKEIAWQKGGIYKEMVPALSVDQPQEGMEVLRERAQELKASEFQVVQPILGLAQIKLGLAGVHQKQNAELAVHLAYKFLQAKATYPEENLLSGSFVRGLETTKWPGRCQTIADPKYPRINWFMDGAHTTESLERCMEWFIGPDVGLKQTESLRVLVFNCTNGRSGESFLGCIQSKILAQLKLHGYDNRIHQLFNHVIFCTNVTYADGGFKGDLTTLAIPADDLQGLKTQRQLASAWSSLVPDFPASSIHVLPSIEHAVDTIHKLQNNPRTVDVLVTGSLHLIGGVIEVAGMSDIALNP